MLQGAATTHPPARLAVSAQDTPPRSAPTCGGWLVSQHVTLLSLCWGARSRSGDKGVAQCVEGQGTHHITVHAPVCWPHKKNYTRFDRPPPGSGAFDAVAARLFLRLSGVLGSRSWRPWPDAFSALFARPSRCRRKVLSRAPGGFCGGQTVDTSAANARPAVKSRTFWQHFAGAKKVSSSWTDLKIIGGDRAKQLRFLRK